MRVKENEKNSSKYMKKLKMRKRRMTKRKKMKKSTMLIEKAVLTAEEIQKIRAKKTIL